MEAKDTVMTHKQRVESSHNPVRELREKYMCEAQAEISFKAGYKSGRDDLRWGGYKSEREVRQAGIREVVEWLHKETGECPLYNDGSYIIAKMRLDKWQAQLKEWGIE